MKKLWNSFLLSLIIGQSVPMFGYAISHNGDSELNEVAIFVFKSEKDFEDMLKKQGVSNDTLKKIADLMPTITKGSSLVAAMSGNPELVPIITALGVGLTSAVTSAVGPVRWIVEQKYIIALHKHTPRGNRGKDSSWNWSSIEKAYGITPEDPNGLFVVFLDPKTKQVLLMTPMKSNAAFGFKAVTDPKTKKLIGEEAPFESKLTEAVGKNPSTLARMYDTAQNVYNNPHKILWSIKDAFNSLKNKFTDFTKKNPSLSDKMGFLGAQLDELKNNIKQYDSKAGKEDLENLMNFFKREIEAGKKIASDPESKVFVNRIVAKFNVFKNTVNDTIVKPQEAYTAGVTKIQKDKAETEKDVTTEMESFKDILGNDIVPIPNAGLDEGSMNG